MTLSAGIATWCAALLVVAYLSERPAGARVAFLVAALILPLPAFVKAPALSRLLLACFVGASFIRAADLLRAPPTSGFRARLALLCAYFDTRLVRQRARGFDAAALATLVASTALLAAAVAVIKAVPAGGAWLPVRWLSGGIGLLAIAEMATACHDLVTSPLGLAVPPLFRAPYRATSIAEFWARRWNLAASEALRAYCFAPLSQRSATFALCFTFAASAAGHALLVRLALKGWWPAASCGAFFLAQPLLIAAERRLGVRRWPSAARRAWTLGALALTAPLVVEPVLQMAEKVWGSPADILPATVAALGFCALVSLITALVSLSLPRGDLAAAEPAAAPERGGE